MSIATRMWIDRYAELLGVSAPSHAEVDQILELAATAAHASERTAAPLSCWLAAAAGLAPAEALSRARELAHQLEQRAPR